MVSGKPTTATRFAATRVSQGKLLPITGAAFLILFIGALINPGIASWSNLNQILAVASILGIAAIGQTLVVLSGDEGIDLSVGQTMSLTAVLSYTWLNGQDGLIPLVVVMIILVGAAIGLANGIGYAVLRLPPLIMTLGMMTVVQGVIIASTAGGSPVGRTPPLLLALGGDRLPFLNIRWLALLGFVMIVAVELILHRTRYGQMLYLVGSNRRAAALLGLPVRRVVIATYTVSAILSGLAGMVLLGYSGTANLDLGGSYMLLTVAAVVLGGTALTGGEGSLAGTALGAIVLTLISAVMLSLGMSEAVRMILTGVVLLVVLVFQGRGPALQQ